MLFVSLPLLAACSDDGGGHDVNKNGVMHKAGLEDPLSNCTQCHGANLRGGSGPSCYSCHGIPASHTAIRGGKAHNPAATSTCVACHGPDNTGGLGPACSTCHG
jgi:DnaJ-class molecular chaperone